MTEQIQGDLILPDASVPVGQPAAPADAPSGASALDPMWVLIRRLPKYARLSAAMARDPRVPGKSKAMLAAGGAYLVSPIDLVPGFIPVAGQLDDLYVVLTGLRQTMRLTPPDIVDEHFARVGLPTTIVDEDLAAIRAFVRYGVRWSIDNGGKAIVRLSQRAAEATRRVRESREGRNNRREGNLNQ